MKESENREFLEGDRENWNDWAEALLNERKDLLNNGQWAINALDWEERAKVDFSGREFGQDVELAGFVFPGRASFNGCIFRADANFRGASFQGDVEFLDVDFWGDALFLEVVFKGEVCFDKTAFHKRAVFDRSAFFGHTKFCHADFEGKACFNAIDVSSSFDLRGAGFGCVPLFVQAAFAEPPRLDNVSFGACLPARRSWDEFEDDPRGSFFKRSCVARDFDECAYWMALRKIAQGSGDHIQRLNFFSHEIQARRFWHDKPFGKNAGRFWFGMFFQWVSNFGRSIFRPLLFWVAGVLGLPVLLMAFSLSSGCNVDWYDFVQVLNFSLSNSIPGLNVLRVDIYENAIQGLLCTKANFYPILGMIFIAHAIWQTLIFFLLFLGVRNNFRIN